MLPCILYIRIETGQAFNHINGAYTKTGNDNICG